jgi:hypothetical protein
MIIVPSAEAKLRQRVALVDVWSDLLVDATFGTVALFVRANSEYLSVADPFYSASFTLSFWFKSTDLPVSHTLVGKDDASGRELLVDKAASGSSGQLAFYVWSDNSTSRVANVSPTVAATWYFVVCWFDDSDKRVRMSLDNGTVMVSTPLPASMQNTGTQLELGRRTYAGFENYFNGQMSNVYFFSTAKDALWRTAMYNGGAGRIYPN